MSLLTKDHIQNLTSKYPTYFTIFSIVKKAKQCQIIGIEAITTLSIESCKIYVKQYIPKSIEWTQTDKKNTSLMILVSKQSKIFFTSINNIKDNKTNLLCGHNTLSKTTIEIQASSRLITRSSLVKAEYISNIFTTIPNYLSKRQPRDLINLFTDTTSPEDLENIVKQENTNIRTFNNNFNNIHNTEQKIINYISHASQAYIKNNALDSIRNEINNLLHNEQLASLTHLLYPPPSSH